MINTARDFIKMLYERECSVVVMLCGCEEGGVEMCAQYWPRSAGTIMKYGEFLVSTVSVINIEAGIQRNLTITEAVVHIYTDIVVVVNKLFTQFPVRSGSKGNSVSDS